MQTIKNLKINLENKILQSNNIIIVPHTKIDFDALGASIGISRIASKFKKKSFILIEEDMAYQIDKNIKNIIDNDKLHLNIINKKDYFSIKQDQDLIVFTDVNKRELTSLKEEITTVDKNNIFIIDHHDIGPTSIESNNVFIFLGASSACEIIAKLLSEFKIKYNADIANYLLAGIYLDTNKLTNNSNPETYKLVAKLLENGANTNIVNSWFAVDFENHRKILNLVNKAKIYEYNFAIVLAEEECKYTKEELAKVSDYLLQYGIDACFVIGKTDNNVVSISARAKDKINVGNIMSMLNGGGNSHSAATMIPKITIDETSKKLMKLLTPLYTIDK